MTHTIKFEDKTLTLQQDAFCDSDNHYLAYAKDEDGEEYEVRWEITNHETENEDETCDWDDFTVIKL